MANSETDSDTATTTAQHIASTVSNKRKQSIARAHICSLSNFIMNDPVNHHFVPKVYLKRFCFNKEGELYTLKSKSKYTSFGNTKKFTPSKICYEKYRYTFDNKKIISELGISDPNIIEKTCFPYESGELSILFDKIDNSQNISNAEYRQIINIILDLKLRNPAYSSQFHNIDIGFTNDFKALEQIKSNSKKLLDILGFSETERDAIINREVKKIQENLKDENYISNFYKKGILSHSIIKESPLNGLLKWEALVLHTNISNPFISSDNPGYTVNNNNKIRNLAFESAFIFVFPISPTSLLILRRPEKEKANNLTQIHHIKASYVEVLCFNVSTLRNSNSIIISQSKEQLEITYKTFYKIQ